MSNISQKEEIWKPPTLAEWIDLVADEPRWIVPNFVPYQGKVLCSGHKKKACKTLFALNMGLAIATGKSNTSYLTVVDEFIGRPVLIVLEEGTPAETKGRILALCKTLDINYKTLEGIVFIFHNRVKLDKDKWRDKILGLVERHKPIITILDPFYKMLTGNENVAAEVMPVIDTLEDIRGLGSAVCLIAHLDKTRGAKKHTSDTIDIDDQVRGTGILTDDYDMHWALRRYNMDDLTIDLVCRSKGDSDTKYDVAWDFADGGAALSIVEESGMEQAYKINMGQLEKGLEYTHKQLKEIWNCNNKRMTALKDKALENGDFKTVKDRTWLYKGA